MSLQQPPNHGALLDAIARSAEKLETRAGMPANRAEFVRAYYREASADDLVRDPRELAAAALSHLEWAMSRASHTAKIRLLNPTRTHDGYDSKWTVVQTVADDMPFLVDSLTMALNAMGHPIKLAVHPVFDVERTNRGRLKSIGPVELDSRKPTESWIHAEVQRETDSTDLRRIESRLGRTFEDVGAAVADWRESIERLRAAAESLRSRARGGTDMSKEVCDFLDWLGDDNFTLLGYREYELVRGASKDKLRARPGTGLGILREELRPLDTMELVGEARRVARSPEPLLITKADARSTVHRPAMLDYISVKVFDDSGRPTAELRFLGLFTSVAYYRSPRDIPLLRRKVKEIMTRSGLDPLSHRGKALQHILDTFPRDDMFQGSIAELTEISLGILALEERHRVRLFLRRDAFGRFYSCLVYLPREQYSAKARHIVEALLKDAIRGEVVDSKLTVSESSLVRIEIMISTPAGRRRGAPDIPEIESRIAEAVRTWDDRVRETLMAELPDADALALLHRFADSFSAAYKEAVDADRATSDMRILLQLFDEAIPLRITLRRAPGAAASDLTLTTYNHGHSIELYEVMPILESMGLKVISEDNYRVAMRGDFAWIQVFGVQCAAAMSFDPEEVQERFEECFARVLRKEAENDAFNNFVLTAGLDWRGAALLRAYCKFILQVSNRFSQAYMLEVLQNYPAFCKALVDEFHASFDPDLSDAARRKLHRDAGAAIRRQTERTTSLDDDRILRAFTSVIAATLRTNYFQHERGAPKPYFSIKFDSSKIPEMPRPRPLFEIFVYSRRVEGVHLRSGKIARGGLRWSDRREDYRTEVLGLMKAQQVKNTVIVPAGAKGGFVCKALPAGDAAAIRAEVVECYRTFIRGLLDVTDNVVANRVTGPDRVLRRDEDDPYLVVAADKGTASFSDIANEISADYRFWLGDAFASGGSSGYDHKKMAITARGAWEGVKRHFREIGVDIQNESFTAVGIGDMAGDVFGNGMLLSRQLKLIAAFNHSHIFVDPNPDAKSSFAERKRLFSLPRSSWDDYRREKLSPGGGVYSRAVKSIELHPDAQAALGLSSAKITPPELIRAILKAKVDLLWNGGIGTYVKSSRESQADAADPANDSVRVNGSELRCRVVGEGGNLGFTQLGRVEYALAGGRLNTDFIDNSGGVDSSDREVNIKILLSDAIRHRRLARSKRDDLLAEMTDRIAELVLANNYAQTQALSMMSSHAVERLGEHARSMRVLESQGLLDRALEFLPTDEEIQERRNRRMGLTRPELAVILSYSKIELSQSLLSTDIPNDPFLRSELEAYFPEQLRRRFKTLIHGHPLRSEIIAMLISSSMINRMGPFFALRAEEDTGATVAQVARAYAIVRELFRIRSLWREIEALDTVTPADAQYDSMFEISRMVRRAAYWFLQRHPEDLDIRSNVERLRGVEELVAGLPAQLAGPAKRRFERLSQQFVNQGLPRALGKQIAALAFATQALDIVDLSCKYDFAAEKIAEVYFRFGNNLRFDWVRDEIEALVVTGRWTARARATLRELLALEQQAIVGNVLRSARHTELEAAVEQWLERSRPRVERLESALNDMRASQQMDFATLSVAINEIGRLV